MTKIAILTISDSRALGLTEDKSGALIKSIVEQKGFSVSYSQIIPDEKEEIKRSVLRLCDNLNFDLILTSGGTGIGLRDNTPEAIGEIIEKELPGISEEIRRLGSLVSPNALLTRAKSGIRGKTLILSLPGSPCAISESLVPIWTALVHALDILEERPHEH